MNRLSARARLRVGAIGAGRWATTNHFPILAGHDDVELTAVCTPDRDALTAVQQAFGFRHGTGDYLGLLEYDLDAVVIASPHHLHHEHAAAALDRGLAVLCEKPMSLTAADAWDLVRRADATQSPLLVAYGWNYASFAEQAKALMEQTGIGEPEYVLCHMASPTRRLFAGRRSPRSHGGLDREDLSTWQDQHRGGGYGHGQLTHAAALMLWLTGLRAASVTASMSAPGAGVDLYDAATVTFTNAAIGVLSGAATLPGQDRFQVDIRVFGSDGVLLLDIERERAEIRRHDGRHHAINIPPGAGDYRCAEPVERFIDLALGRPAANNSPAHLAARSVELLEAMYRSAATGQTVTVDAAS